MIDQKTGNISFYRATGGVPYNPNPQKVVNVHPTKLQQINNTLQALNGCFRLDPLTSYEQLKRSLKEASNYDELKGIISLLSRDFNFLDNGYTPHIIDYPFAHTPGTFDKTDKKCKVGKELSFAYTPLSGFLFDGVSASTQSACPFVYAFEHGQYNPYFYTLTYPLVEFMENLNLRTNLQWEYPNIYTSGDFTNFTSLPTVPLHQAILHSGEGFHPRFTFNSLRSYQEELHEFYDHITIISLYGECADTETNKPFVQDMLRRHKDLVLSILDAEEKPHNTNVNQEKRLNDPSLVKVLNYYQSSYPKSDFAKLDAEQSNKLLTRAHQLKKENNIVDGIALNQALKELTAISEIDSSLVAVLKYYQSAYTTSPFAKLDKEQSNKLLTRAQQLKKENNIVDGIALNQALKELTAVSEIDSSLVAVLGVLQINPQKCSF